MRFSYGYLILALIALLFESASAEENIFIEIRTLLYVAGTISAPKLKAIDTAMNEIGTKLDNEVKKVLADAAVPPVRNLRVHDGRKLCNPCSGYPSKYDGCWVSGTYVTRCRRALTMHEDLSEDDIANLNEDDRRCHLEVAALCQEAKTGVSSTIVEAASEGVVPLPDGSKLVEQCFYEISD